MKRVHQIAALLLISLSLNCRSSRRQQFADAPSGCQFALQVVNETGDEIEAHWAMSEATNPSIVLGKARNGTDTLPLPEAVVTRFKAEGNHYYFLRTRSTFTSERDERGGSVDMRKVRHRVICRA